MDGDQEDVDDVLLNDIPPSDGLECPEHSQNISESLLNLTQSVVYGDDEQIDEKETDTDENQNDSNQDGGSISPDVSQQEQAFL